MLLEIFVKRKQGGDLITSDFHYTKSMIECKEVKKSEPKDGVIQLYITDYKGEVQEVVILTNTHGYKLYNESGLQVDGYVSSCDSYEPQNYLSESEAVDFGNYLLSQERENLLKQSEIENPNSLPYEESKRFVYDADLANWRDKQK